MEWKQATLSCNPYFIGYCAEAAGRTIAVRSRNTAWLNWVWACLRRDGSLQYGNGHYIFFSVRDDNDHGTIIDFLQRRENLSLGAVRQILRPWIGRPVITLPFPNLAPTSANRMLVESEYRCA